MGSEIKFEPGAHRSDPLASLMLEGGILPSVKKHYLQKGVLFHCGFWSGLMKNFYKVKESQRAPHSSESQEHLARVVPQKQEEESF